MLKTAIFGGRIGHQKGIPNNRKKRIPLILDANARIINHFVKHEPRANGIPTVIQFFPPQLN